MAKECRNLERVHNVVPILIVRLAVPWDELLAYIWEGTENETLAESFTIRMLRLFKVLRIARASRLIKRITISLTLHTKFVESAIFFMYHLANASPFKVE